MSAKRIIEDEADNGLAPPTLHMIEDDAVVLLGSQYFPVVGAR